MDTDQSNKPPPLPAKLRWRPYANGTSKKNSKLKKIPPQQPNPKATAHKVKGQQYYTGKSQRPLAGVQLQWEEAETIESMSHGGHAHHTHPNHHSSRETSPSASSTSSASSSSSPTGATPGGSASQRGAQNSVSTSTSTSNNSFANLVHRAMNPLPSPPLKMSNTRLDLVGAQCDLSQVKASVPALIGNGLLQNGVSLNASVPDTAEAYQVLFNALFQTQTKGTTVFHTPALIGNSNGGAPLANPPAAVPAAPMATSSPSALLGSTNINILLSDPDRGLDTNELLGIGSLDELLTSCGYSESPDVFSTQALQMLASPISIDANQSFNSSPVSSVLDLNGTSNVSRAPSPALASFSPMAFSNSALEALLSQPVMSQQPSSQQQSPIGTSSALPMNDLYSILSQDLSSPFDCLSIGADPSPAVWTSLFPTMETSATTINTTANATSQGQLQSQPQRTEMATQTDGPYDPSHSPISAKVSTSGSQHSSPLSVPGLSPEAEMNSSWGMPSPPPSGDESDENPEDVKSTQQGRDSWNWMDEWLKPSVMTPTGSGMFGSGLPNGTIGNGGLIRTLQGTGQRKPSKTNPSAAQGTLADQPKEKDAGKADNSNDHKPETVSKDSIKTKIVPSVESSGPVDKKEPSEEADKKEGFGGLITAMLKSLWIGKNEGDKDK